MALAVNLRASAGDIRGVGSIPGLGRYCEEYGNPTPVFLPGEFPQTVESGGLTVRGVTESDHDKVIKAQHGTEDDVESASAWSSSGDTL